MKKLLLILAIGAFVACNDSATDEGTTADTSATTTPSTLDTSSVVTPAPGTDTSGLGTDTTGRGRTGDTSRPQ